MIPIDAADENDDNASSTMQHNSVNNNCPTGCNHTKPHYSVISNADNNFFDRSGLITTSMLTITNNAGYDGAVAETATGLGIDYMPSMSKLQKEIV